MAKQKFDGVIEVVRYTPEGLIDVVRAFERRGATFSDRVLWKRAELLERLKAGQKIVVGSPKLYLASTFAVGAPVRLERSRSGEMIVTGKESSDRDRLSAPLF